MSTKEKSKEGSKSKVDLKSKEGSKSKTDSKSKEESKSKDECNTCSSPWRAITLDELAKHTDMANNNAWMAVKGKTK